MKFFGIFLALQFFSAGAWAGDLYLYIDYGNIHTSGEAEASMNLALKNNGCGATPASCDDDVDPITHSPDGWNCSSQSDNCMAPSDKSDEDPAQVCQSGFTPVHHSNDLGNAISEVKAHEWSALLSSRTEAEEWAADDLILCKRN